MKRKRFGHSLVELMVALPVAAMLGAVAVALLLDTQKLVRRMHSSTEIARELRQAGAVLSSEIRALSAADLISWSDTTLEMQSLTGSGIVCGTPASNQLDLLPLHGTDALRTSWFATPQGGDQVFTVSVDSGVMPEPTQWEVSTVRSISSSVTSACSATPLYTGGTTGSAAVVRVTLAAPLATLPHPGTLVRFTRRVRYSLYKASDGLWYLGQKSFGSVGWSTIQPVAGALLSPARTGLQVHVRDSVGNSFAFGTARTPHSVNLVMHAASRWLRAPSVAGVSDSLAVTVTLRGQTTVAP